MENEQKVLGGQGDLMRKKVLLRGPFLTNSGYGVHSRQLARWAVSRSSDWDVKFQVLPWGITPWILDRDQESGLIGQIMDRTGINEQDRFDISIQVQLPNEWDHSLARINVGVTAGVETDVCNPEWVPACNKMNAVIVPSSHSRNSFIKTGATGLRSPIYIVPESFYDEILQDPDPLDIDFSTDFNFLIFGQLTGNNPENDRKNIFYTLKWMFEEFKNDSNVGIILKTNSGRTTKIDRAVTERLVRQLTGEARSGVNPRVHLLHGSMSNREVSGLMRHPKVKALVSLTRGEGYGLPILEAAASGLPVIATNWSGYTDFLGQEDFTPVDYTLAPIHKSRVDGKIFVEGARWAQVDEINARKKMRKLYQKPSMPFHRAKEAAKRIKRDFSFESISKKLDETFGEILG
jgi:glycosyltransferase involved in cell wall biosynthesis